MSETGALFPPIESFSRWAPITRSFHLDFLVAQGLVGDDTLLDVGCGPLTTGQLLIERLAPGNYTGIDNNPIHLKWAEERIEREGMSTKRPTITLVDDLASYRGSSLFTWICAFSLMIHLDAQGLAGLFTLAHNNLADTGRFYGNVNVGPERSESFGGGVTYWNPLDYYEALANAAGLKMTPTGRQGDLGLATGDRQEDQVMLSFARTDEV